MKHDGKVTLYHATSMQVLDNIIKDGSLNTPQETGVISNGLGFDRSGEQNGIYLASTPDDVSIYYDGAVKQTQFDKMLPNCGVLLELEVDEANLVADMDDYKGEERQGITWQDSLESSGQVAHIGHIDIFQIQGVQFKALVELGGYIEDGNDKTVRERLQLRKDLQMQDMMSLDEATGVMNDVNQGVIDKYAAHYHDKVVQEQSHCVASDKERLRLVQEKDVGVGEDGVHRYLLAVSRLNDLDVEVEGAEHHKDVMLVDNGKDSKIRHHRLYTKDECDGIVERTDKKGVFLAKVSDTQVDISTVEPSNIAYNHDKHVENTELYRASLVDKQALRDVVAKHEVELSI